MTLAPTKKKLNALEGYQKVGGLGGYAAKILSDEIKKAERQQNHSLNTYVKAVQDGNATLAAEKLLESLIMAIHDKKSPLSLPALLYLEMPLATLETKYAAENYDDDSIFDKLPREIKRFSGILLGYSSAKSQGGRGKGKKWDALVESKYDQHKNLRLPATQLAKKIHNQLLKELNIETADNEDGTKNPSIPVPSIDFITKRIRVLKKQPILEEHLLHER